MKLSAPIYVLKKQAKELKRERSVSLAEALDLVARREGYNSWSLLQAKSGDLLPCSYSEVLDFFNPGDVALIGGRPAHGKTSFAVGLFVQSIKTAEVMHFLFTLDLPHREIARRIAGYDETIGGNDKRFELDYSDDISADYIIERTKDKISKGSLIVVDYLQLLDHKRSNPPLQEQIEKLKSYANEKGCIILFLSQIHRAIEARADKRPTLDDIKLVNPLNLRLFNKVIFLYKEINQLHSVEVILHRPRRHVFKVAWDPMLSRFSDASATARR